MHLALITRHLSLVAAPTAPQQFALRRGAMVNSRTVPLNADRPAPSPHGDNWVHLVRRTAAGEHAALAELYDNSCHLVFGLALRILGDHAAAEDAVVEVYAQAWREAKSFDGRRGTASAWLLTLTRSRAIDLLRTRQRERAADPLDSAGDVPSALPNPEESASSAERDRSVRNALQTLSAEQRQAIELAYFSGFSHTEIALRLGQPLGTVKTRIRLGMLRLRELLGHVATPVVAAGKDSVG